MLVVRVELHSAIDGSVTEIANMVIYNDGPTVNSDDPHTFNYQGLIFKDGKLWDDGKRLSEQRESIEREARVEGHPQRTQDGKFTSVWHLISNLLEAARFGW